MLWPHAAGLGQQQAASSRQHAARRDTGARKMRTCTHTHMRNGRQQLAHEHVEPVLVLEAKNDRQQLTRENVEISLVLETNR